MSDSWRDTYDAWKLRSPYDDYLGQEVAYDDSWDERSEDDELDFESLVETLQASAH